MPELSASESGRLRQEPISDVVVDALRTDTKYLGGISFGQRLKRCDRHLQNIAGGDVLSSQLFYPSLDSGNGTATCGGPSRRNTHDILPPPASQPGANRVGFRDLTTELCRTFFDLDASEVTGIKRLSIR